MVKKWLLISYLDTIIASRYPAVLHLNVGRRMCEFTFCIWSRAFIPLKFATHLQLQPSWVLLIYQIAHIEQSQGTCGRAWGGCGARRLRGGRPCCSSLRGWSGCGCSPLGYKSSGLRVVDICHGGAIFHHQNGCGRAGGRNSGRRRDEMTKVGGRGGWGWTPLSGGRRRGRGPLLRRCPASLNFGSKLRPDPDYSKSKLLTSGSGLKNLRPS